MPDNSGPNARKKTAWPFRLGSFLMLFGLGYTIRGWDGEDEPRLAIGIALVVIGGAVLTWFWPRRRG